MTYSTMSKHSSMELHLIPILHDCWYLILWSIRVCIDCGSIPLTSALMVSVRVTSPIVHINLASTHCLNISQKLLLAQNPHDVYALTMIGWLSYLFYLNIVQCQYFGYHGLNLNTNKNVLGMHYVKDSIGRTSL